MLTRTATGLLFRDDFTRANGAPGANWSSGTIVANRLTLASGQGETFITAAGMAAVVNQHVQALQSRTDLGYFAAIMARRISVNDFFQSDHRLNAGPPQMYRRTGGGFTQIGGNGTFTPAANVFHRYAMSAIGTDIRAWTNGLLQHQATDATAQNQAAGTPGFNVFGSGTSTIDEVIVCSHRTVTVNGLPAGYKIRANGLTSAGAIAATPLVLDLLGTLLPVTLLEVLTAGDAVVDSTVIEVFGGDVFTYVGVPEVPNITAQIAGLTIDLTGSAFASSVPGDAHAGSQWQIAAATDPTFAAPFFDSGLDAVHKTALTVAGMPQGVNLLARVRYQGINGFSLYSAAVAVGSLALWNRTDLGPDVPGSGVVPITTFLGLGPVAGLPRNNLVQTIPGPSGVYDGVLMSYDAVVVNPAGMVGNASETIQRNPNTNTSSAAPLVITFDRPIRGFSATMTQRDFLGGKMEAKDVNGTVIATALYNAPFGPGENNLTLYPRTVDAGANLIRSIVLTPDGSDWSVWQDLYLILDHAAGDIGGWEQTDLDPGVGAWAGADAAPATAWSN